MPRRRDLRRTSWYAGCRAIGYPAHRGRRKAHGEGRAVARLAPDRDLSAVVGTDVLDNGQSQTGATRGSGPSGVDAVEPLENPRLLALGNALALVGDRDLDKLIRRTHADRYPGARRGVVDGVADEVADGGRRPGPGDSRERAGADFRAVL